MPDSAEEKKRVKRIAEQILTGQIGVLLGVRTLLPSLYALGLENQKSALILVGIDSETDHLPLGKERGHWHPDALTLKDKEILEAENLYRQAVLEACRDLVDLLDKDKLTF